MINYRGIIINGFDHIKPSCRITPFKEENILNNQHRCQSKSSGNIFNYFNRLFPEKSVYLMPDGRSAIGCAIEVLGLEGDDCVTIITTTNNFYISGCVTQEIEKRCKWSRELNSNTKAIFVNHEFGLFCRDIARYKNLGIPIIEDFAHSFCSLADSASSAMQGDFLVCSFSKIFPMQAGGVLLMGKNYNRLDEGDSQILHYVNSNASFYIDTLEDIKNRRWNNYEILSKKFQSIGVSQFFNFSKNEVPGVFCFKLQKNINAPKFKEFMNVNGVESSIFYGENAYFIPCHQSMSEEDIGYVFEVARYFLDK